MKKLFLILSIVISFKQVNAQTYFHFSDSSATWIVLFEYQSNPNDYYSQIYNYSLLGDTVFHNVNYHKIYKDGIYFGSIRQDTLQKSIYYHGVYNGNFAEDTLLYKFGLNVGDSIPIKFPVSKTEKIISIDSISIAGKYRKRYNMNNDEWIEGIGSTHFLFLPFDYEFEWHWTLLCYSENGNQLYQQNYYSHQSGVQINGCSGQILGITEKKENHLLTVFPNPTCNQFLITTNMDEKLNVDLYDLNGRHLLNKTISDKTNIDLTAFDEGIYNLVIKSANSIINKKLVIVR